MLGLYSVPEPPLDPPEPKIVGRCEHCDEDIYDGDDIVTLEGVQDLEIIAPATTIARRFLWSREARTCLLTGAPPVESETTIRPTDAPCTQATRTRSCPVAAPSSSTGSPLPESVIPYPWAAPFRAEAGMCSLEDRPYKAIK